MYDLIVIGAGPGGYEAAAHAGKLGKKVAIVEKKYMGGTCLNVGCIPAKTFLHSSKLFRAAREAAKFGVRLGSPEFDLPIVVERKNRIVGVLTKGVEGILKRAGVEVIAGQAKLVSRSAVEVDSKRYEAANILIATGSRPAKPPIPGIDAADVFDSDTIFGLTRIPPSIAIVGGGYIGLEFACFFNEIGSQVTVFEMLPQVAAGADQEIATRLLQVMKRNGVQFHLSCRVSKLDPKMIHYTGSDGTQQTASADLILNSTGRSPLVDNLGLEAVGVDFTARGIRTSDRGKTNIPGIWACGDVTGRRMLAHAATREGMVAVNNMFGGNDRVRYDSIPSVIYTHPEVAAVGRTEEELKAQNVAYKKSVVPMAVAGRFLIENEVPTGVVKVLAGARYGEILGVHAIGDPASEFIIAAAAMVESEACISDIRDIVFPHPTVSEALREAILAVSQEIS
jgi:dihydrolipoamide dehydrogenase